MAEIKYPYLAYSELTGCVYIVLNKNKKVDVTSQYEFIVKNKSAADVVEVVRCDNCKHCVVREYDIIDEFECEIFDVFTDPLDYCSHGERKENELPRKL